MARPTRQGIDYFSLDVHLDDKFKFIEIKYKLEGFAIIMKLLQKIYSSSYWYKWTDDEALLFADENRTDYSLVKNVVQEAVERGIFNQELYEKHGILTSKGIQKRYKEAVRRRKEVEIMSEYLLIDDDFGVNDGNNSPNDNIMPSPSKRNDGKSTQSKVNKTKVKDIKDKDVKTNYAEFVSFELEEYEKLVELFGKEGAADKIENLNLYKGSKGVKYKSDYMTILGWERKNGKNNNAPVSVNKQPKLFDEKDFLRSE
jgi:hypothetical protein